MTSERRVRQSRKTAESRRPSSEADWSMMPVGAPTALFSASWPTLARVGRSSPSCQLSSRATATAHSMAADDDRLTPRERRSGCARRIPAWSRGRRRSHRAPTRCRGVRGPAVERLRAHVSKLDLHVLGAEGAGDASTCILPEAQCRPGAPIDREGKHKALVVVGVLADEVDTPRRGPDAVSGTAELGFEGGGGGGNGIGSGVRGVRHTGFSRSARAIASRTRAADVSGNVSDEGAHGRLGASQELESVLGPPGRGDLQHEPRRVPSHVYGGLVPGGDVRGGSLVEGVYSAQETQVQDGELVAFFGAQSREVGHVAVRQHVHLDGPARGEGHERGEVLAAQQHALRRLLALEDLREHVAAEAVDRVEQLRGAGVT